MSGATTLLAAADKYPNLEAQALAPTAGFLMLFCAVCLAVIFIVHRETWRRLWLRAEDPRSLGLFRIAFGLCAIANVNGLWELFHYLFTDEGLFMTDAARQIYAREQFEGFGNGLDGDPYGFFDIYGVWEWLKGPKYSLLFFWDSPTAFWIHWAAWQIAMIMFVIGLGTRYTKWIAWFLFHSIILRNTVYWEGTENVYRCFFFYLAVSKCGHAYSVDNWLRCRKLRQQGRLSEPGLPGEGAGAPPSESHPHGLQPIYRLIPSWPRILVVLQCAALYCYTGVVKNGSIWWRGDAFYYAFNLDHFYRIPPQQLSAIFGTNLFRLNTHVVHWWESLFPLCVFAMCVRFGLRERVPAPSGLARVVHGLAWLGLGLGVLALCESLYPVHFVQPRGSWWTLERVQWAFGLGWIGGMALVAWLWQRLRWRPFQPRFGGRKRTIDLDTALKWTMGRRWWVLLGTIFHLHLMILMNIGWFQAGALVGFICYLNGSEVALAFTILGRGLAKVGVPGLPDRVRRGHDPLPAADPTLPEHHRDGVRLPVSAMYVGLGIAVAGVFAQYYDLLHYGWTLAGLAAFLAGTLVREARSGAHEPYHVRPEAYERPEERRVLEPLGRNELARPWAYGPLGRFVVSCLTIYHVVGVACWLLPDKDSFQWRTKTHEPFKWWLETTQTTQGWKMFAPNPPRSNMFLKVLVTDVNGQVWDMKTDFYAEEQRPIPWIWYTRQRKINRRIAGGEGGKGDWYQKWHARYFCRDWALDHDGELPDKVELVKITYPIPTPEWLSEHGAYDPVERLAELGKEEVVYTVRCRFEADAQLPDVVRDRHGFGKSDVDVRRWGSLRNKKALWDRKRERAAGNEGQ